MLSRGGADNFKSRVRSELSDYRGKLDRLRSCAKHRQHFHRITIPAQPRLLNFRSNSNMRLGTIIVDSLSTSSRRFIHKKLGRCLLRTKEVRKGRWSSQYGVCYLSKPVANSLFYDGLSSTRAWILVAADPQLAVGPFRAVESIGEPCYKLAIGHS